MRSCLQYEVTRKREREDQYEPAMKSDNSFDKREFSWIGAVIPKLLND